MVIVTGTKRSGTSLWMQLLAEGGLPFLGEEFPRQWGVSIREANPRGFYESRLRHGVFYATNPDPTTGEYLAPGATKGHAVKVFIPGLVRTDVAYIDKVIATMRHWRVYSSSMTALNALEARFRVAQEPEFGGEEGSAAPIDGDSQRNMPLAVEWFQENFELIRDFAVRRYPLHMVTYDRLLEKPRGTLEQVMGWLGVGDPVVAARAIEPTLQRQTRHGGPPSGVSRRDEEVFDRLFASVHERSAVPADLAGEMNETFERLVDRYGGLSRDRDAPDKA